MNHAPAAGSRGSLSGWKVASERRRRTRSTVAAGLAGAPGGGGEEAEGSEVEAEEGGEQEGAEDEAERGLETATTLQQVRRAAVLLGHGDS